MKEAAGGFNNNQMYTSTNFPALKPFSVHTFSLVGVALISSLFAGAAAYAVRPALGEVACVGAAIGTSIIVLLSEVLGGMRYLIASGRKKADEAVHLSKKSSQP
jgi:hypothetical protein